ncbi:MAG TPA: sugar transferase [Acholeplasma sp.]|nr:sugar transferase [Acholeplasma sp.]
MKKFKQVWNGSLVRFVEYGLDSFIMIFSLMTAIQIHHSFAYGYLYGWDLIIGKFWHFYWPFLLVYVLVTLIVLKIYNATVINNTYKNAMVNTALALVFMNAPLIIYNFWRYDNFIFEPWYLFVVVGIEIVVYAIYKRIFYKILVKYDRQYALMVGPKEEIELLASKYMLSKVPNRLIKYIYYTDEKTKIDSSIYNLIDEVDSVYISENLDTKAKELILDYAAYKNFKEVYVVPRKMDVLLIDSVFETIDDSLVLHAKNMHLSIEMRFLKRTIDLIVSTIGLIVAAIPMIFVALIIKLQDGGPVFYKQERFKRYNQPFYILKFRSMTHKQTKEQEQTLATRNDARITKFGKFIRATRLDELPQLFNVFKGDMSLVGPRPYMKSVVDEAMEKNPDFLYRSNVKPGITGLSHIYGRYDTTSEERLRYDLLYVRKCSLWLDIKIVFLTILVMFNKDAGLGRARELTFNELLDLKQRELVKLNDCPNEVFEVLDKSK